jgi:hypothetical protein
MNMPGKTAVFPSSHGMHPAAYAASCSLIPPLLRRLRLLLLERRVLPVARLRERLLELPLLRRERLLLERRLVPVLRERVLAPFDRLLLDFLVAISYCLLS